MRRWHRFCIAYLGIVSGVDITWLARILILRRYRDSYLSQRSLDLLSSNLDYRYGLTLVMCRAEEKGPFN